MPIPKSIELLRIDGEDAQPARETRIDERAPRRFDRHRDLRRRDAVYAMIQSRHACTASAVWATRRSSRRRPVASTTQTA